MRISAASMLLATLTAGCGGGARHDVPTTFTPPSPIGATVYTILPGAGTLVGGDQPGMGVTVASDASEWRAVWTGNSALDYTDFRGYIYTAGTFTSVTPGCSDGSCALEAGDILAAPVAYPDGGQWITFDTQALDGFDGLDFSVDSQPVAFYLEVQYQAAPALVYFTDGTNLAASPTALPFGLETATP
jgi:hypothetical protein